MASPFTDLSVLLGDPIKEDSNTKQSMEQGKNSLKDNLTLITSLVQTAYHTNKVTGDPLATDLWRLCTKAQHSIPQAKRFENLMWRRMAIKLVRAKRKSPSIASTSTPSPEEPKQAVAPLPTRNFAEIAPRPPNPNAVNRVKTNPIKTKGRPKLKSKLSTTVRDQAQRTKRENQTHSIQNQVQAPQNHDESISNRQSQQSYPMYHNLNANYNLGISPSNEFPLADSRTVTPDGFMQQQSYFTNVYDPNQINFDMMNQNQQEVLRNAADMNVMNQFAMNSNQSWYDPTFANFGSILNRNWSNFDDSTGQVNFPFTQNDFADYTTMNSALLRRARLDLPPNNINSSSNFNQNSIQSAQANRIRQLEQQLSELMASRTTNTSSYTQQNNQGGQKDITRYNESVASKSANNTNPITAPMQNQYRQTITRTHSKPEGISLNQYPNNLTLQNQNVYISNIHNQPTVTHTSRFNNQIPLNSSALKNETPKEIVTNLPIQNHNVDPKINFHTTLLGNTAIKKSIPEETDIPKPRPISKPSTSQSSVKADKPLDRPEVKKSGSLENAKIAPLNSSLANSSTKIVCTNCGVDKTSLWRRASNGAPLCNACGLFSKLHGKERPLSMKTDVIRKRNRGPANARSMLTNKKKATTPDP